MEPAFTSFKYVWSRVYASLNNFFRRLVLGCIDAYENKSRASVGSFFSFFSNVPNHIAESVGHCRAHHKFQKFGIFLRTHWPKKIIKRMEPEHSIVLLHLY